MGERVCTSSVQASVDSVSPGDRLWAVVLAGGQGVRLRPLARRVCGDDRPKQYVPLLGARTLLEQTLDRVALGVPAARTVVVTVKNHARYVAPDRSPSARPRVLAQPDDRGTAAGILFPAHWISWRDPEATVAVFPSDHFALEEAAFMEHVAAVAAWVHEHADRIVLLGAAPSGPEVEYGWIERGAVLGRAGGGAICTIRRFWEKPSPEAAAACLAGDCLWNTFVMVAGVRALLRAGMEQLPRMSERLALIAPFSGTEDEAWAIHQAYALMPRENFSRAILEALPAALAVSALPPLTWSDLGTPRRVFELLSRVRLEPPWLVASERPA
jgi:mannose-1-phosphate guanylyltransferase